MRTLAVLLLVVGTAAAGCVGGGTDPAPAVTSAPSSASTSQRPHPDSNASAPPALVAKDVSLAWNGTLGVFASGCVNANGFVCKSQAATSRDAERLVPQQTGNLTAANVRLEWEATSAATATLGMGLMVMGTCGGCETTLIGRVTGASPLTIETSGLHIPLDKDHPIHVFVWNPQGFQSADPATLYATPDQAFQVIGSATVVGGT
jgi:hypothetical protein